jgi:glycosyltransferase involved in cell wall biosynthesis
MKITHVIESGGGSADFVLYLVKYLPHHHHTIIYGERTFGKRINEVKQTYTNATFYSWNYVQREIGLLKDIKATISLFKLLKNIEGDVVHVHSSKAGFLGRFVCYFLGKRNVIYTPNGLPFIRKDISLLKVKIYIFLEKTANWLCGRIISCSKSEAEELIKKGINSIYINNGTEIFDYKNEGQLDKNRKFIIATTGRVTIQKNPLLFNEIAKQFETDARYQFLWIGGGELEHLLTSKNIRISGWLNKSEVINTLSKTDLYISTASWEGLPFAVLEAMNLLKPLLLSNCVGNTDLVINNYNGFIFTTVEEAVIKINFIGSKREIVQEYGNNSYKLLVKDFNVELMAKQYESEYKKFTN